MFIHRSINLYVIFRFAWKMLLASFTLSLAVFVLYNYFHLNITIPFLPVATIGTAVAFYVGFKNNSAYDRLWEARKIWGSITNASRMWGAMVIDIVGSRSKEDLSSLKKEMVYRHIAWLNMVRLQLRRYPVFDTREYTSSAQLKIVERTLGKHSFESHVDEVLGKFISTEERKAVEEKQNMANHLLKRQHAMLIELKNKDFVDGFEHSDMDRLILEFFNQQGAAERIKGFPFPRQYANFSFVFVYIFVFLLPFSLIGEIDKINNNLTWLVVPFTMLIAWVFNVMEQVGDASENPFDNGINDVPMTAICRNIEIDLREMLGEKDLPQKIKPVDGIIM
jgi:ion channel-forming bestrophin family protein